jgi:GNAT superfamily N-acetyltransferase
MIRLCNCRDLDQIWTIINDGALAYKGIIPADRWAEPYMPREKLQHEIDAGVLFSGYEENGVLLAVMGIQHVQDVTLIRHAYVRTNSQKRGIGALLLAHLRELAPTPFSLALGPTRSGPSASTKATASASSIPKPKIVSGKNTGPSPNDRSKLPSSWPTPDGKQPDNSNSPRNSTPSPRHSAWQ